MRWPASPTRMRRAIVSWVAGSCPSTTTARGAVEPAAMEDRSPLEPEVLDGIHVTIGIVPYQRAEAAGKAGVEVVSHVGSSLDGRGADRRSRPCRTQRTTSTIRRNHPCVPRSSCECPFWDGGRGVRQD